MFEVVREMLGAAACLIILDIRLQSVYCKQAVFGLGNDKGIDIGGVNLGFTQHAVFIQQYCQRIWFFAG